MASVDAINGKGVITGPSYDVNTLNIVHEFLHGIINPIIDSTRNTDDDAETIVRSLSGLLVFDEDEASSYVDREVDRGFKKARKVFDTFSSEYPDYKGSLEEFIREKF